MDFGMPTLIELDSLSDTVSLCKALGLRFVELNMNLPWYQPDKLSADMLSPFLDGTVYFTIHLDENLDPWHFNPLISKACTDTALAAIRVAGETGIPVLNMHMNHGVYFKLPGQQVYLYSRFRDEYMRKTRGFRDACEQAIGNRAIKICVENCGGFTDFELEALDLLLQSPAFALTLDIGHSHAAGGRDEPFILQNLGRLTHMHIHDAIGEKNHLPLSSGEIDIAARLALAQAHNCRCVLEVKTVEGLKASVKHIKEHYAAYMGIVCKEVSP